jgi:hypothetical protein
MTDYLNETQATNTSNVAAKRTSEAGKSIFDPETL